MKWKSTGRASSIGTSSVMSRQQRFKPSTCLVLLFSKISWASCFVLSSPGGGVVDRFRGRKARLNNKSSTSGQLADRNDVDDLGKAGGATDDVGPDGRRQRPRKLKDDHQPHSGDGAAEATSSAGQKGSNGVDDESKGESWDVLHGVKGMKKTRTGRYVPDDGRDGGDDATPAPSAE